MKGIAYMFGAVIALTGALVHMAPHLNTPREQPHRSLESKFLPDTAIGS
jgi:hypothetical protein